MEQAERSEPPRGRLYTIGHSTRSEEEFLDLLKRHKVRYLLDVRRFPGSRRNPQFSKENLEKVLAHENMVYLGLGQDLGGFRKEGYETYMNTQTFRRGIEELDRFAVRANSVILCAESLWFRCHRRHIADELVSRGWEVVHILGADRLVTHPGDFPTQEPLPR